MSQFLSVLTPCIIFEVGQSFCRVGGQHVSIVEGDGSMDKRIDLNEGDLDDSRKYAAFRPYSYLLLFFEFLNSWYVMYDMKQKMFWYIRLLKDISLYQRM